MDRLHQLIGALITCCFLLIASIVLFVVLMINPDLISLDDAAPKVQEHPHDTWWHAPDSTLIPSGPEGDLIRYGRELVRATSHYLGPNGTLEPMSNGMNCQNCHIESGTKTFGNNYGSVASQYPKFRTRSGAIESIEMRVNDCFKRSLNGGTLDSLSKEMRAIVAYIRWVGKDVPKGEKAPGSGLMNLAYLTRAADTIKGKAIFNEKCQRCHGASGEGKRGKYNYFEYPPLWGNNSFNTGAGLYRISNLARYVYANMPNGNTFEKPELKPEEAWDVAAYIASMPRPVKHFAGDWPVLKDKPVDHPFGPYADNFSEYQHKYGPFPPIEEARRTN